MKYRFLGAKKLVDYWSIPHFLFGTVTALFSITFSLSIPLMFLMTVCFAILWELLEIWFRQHETRGNSVLDALLALSSFALTFALVDWTDPNLEHHSALLIVTGIIFLCLNFFAWRARFDHDREFLN